MGSSNTKTLAWYNTDTTDFYSYDLTGDTATIDSLAANFLSQYGKADLSTLSEPDGLKILAKKHIDGLKCFNLNLNNIEGFDFLQKMKITYLYFSNCIIRDDSIFLNFPNTLTYLEIINFSTWTRKAISFWTMINKCVNLKTLKLVAGNFTDLGFDSPIVIDIFTQIVNRLDRIDMSKQLLSQLWDHFELLKLAISKHWLNYFDNSTTLVPLQIKENCKEEDVIKFMSLIIEDKPIDLELTNSFDLLVYQRLIESDVKVSKLNILSFKDKEKIPLIKNIDAIHFWSLTDDFCEWLCQCIQNNDLTLKSITTGMDALTKDQYDKIQEALKSNPNIKECRFLVKK